MLYERLSEYDKKGVIPMHMPGHKRNAAMLGDGLPYHIDITEIDGFDNLHDACGVLKETADIARGLYGGERAFPLVNGSTGGILAAVYAATRRGDTVVMARNCHKSVYNAVLLGGLKPVYLMPGVDEASGIFGSVTPRQIGQALAEHPRARLVIVTSPTYEGVVSDIGGICEAAHRQDVPVLVDAAHGAHLGFSKNFPVSSVACGADLVVMSLHKTLPALTQCALAHVSGSRVDEGRLQNALALFETSSPSYVLLSSIDRCVRLLTAQKETLFGAYEARLRAFDESVGGLKRLKILCHGADALSDHPQFYGFDPGKIVISTRGTDLTGPALTKILRSKYKIEMEMAAPDYVLAMTSVCDESEAFTALADALLELDETARPSGPQGAYTCGALPPKALEAHEAAGLDGAFAALEESAGMISLEYVWAYPPGIPMLVPGERIDAAALGLMRQTLASGVGLKSTRGGLPPRVYCARPDLL